MGWKLSILFCLSKTQISLKYGRIFHCHWSLTIKKYLMWIVALKIYNELYTCKFKFWYYVIFNSLLQNNNPSATTNMFSEYLSLSQTMSLTILTFQGSTLECKLNQWSKSRGCSMLYKLLKNWEFGLNKYKWLGWIWPSFSAIINIRNADNNDLSFGLPAFSQCYKSSNIATKYHFSVSQIRQPSIKRYFSDAQIVLFFLACVTLYRC